MITDIRNIIGCDVERRLHEADFAVLPLGSVEWHGPHLPLGTDTVIAEGFARELESGDWDAIQYPTVGLTAVPGQTRHYPGTIAIKPDTMVSYLAQILEQIARSGLERILVLNAHDANMATVRAAMEWVSGEVPVSILLANWFQLVPWEITAGLLGDGPARGHGGAFETAGVIAFRPELVRLDTVDDMTPRPRLETAPHVLVESHPSPWAGWSGHVSMANETGASHIREHASRTLRELVQEWLERPAPEPAGTELNNEGD